jgi:peptidoglycan/LPS O-acetylase OafA/YrhL
MSAATTAPEIAQSEAGTTTVRGDDTVVQAGETRSARVESIRALACLGVLVGHIFGNYHSFSHTTIDSVSHRLLLGGGIGVFVFFALTGYLLYWPFVRRDFGTGTPVNLRHYARNRVLRILPLYFVALPVTLLWREGGGSLSQWAKFMTLSENFFHDTVGKVNPAIWSVVVEIHFYILLPLIALTVAAIARRRTWVALAVLAVPAVISLYIWQHHVAGRPAPLWRYNLPSTFFCFLPGMSLAFLRLEMERGRIRLPAPLDRSDLWIAGSIPFFLYSLDKIKMPPVTVAAFLLLGGCVLPLRSGVLARSLSWRPLAYVGVVSYSIYVWQGPVIHQVYDSLDRGLAAVLLGPLMIAVGVLSFRVVETPFLRLRRRWSPASAPQPATRVT